MIVLAPGTSLSDVVEGVLSKGLIQFDRMFRSRKHTTNGGVVNVAAGDTVVVSSVMPAPDLETHDLLMIVYGCNGQKQATLGNVNGRFVKSAGTASVADLGCVGAADFTWNDVSAFNVVARRGICFKNVTAGGTLTLDLVMTSTGSNFNVGGSQAFVDIFVLPYAAL